jgi:hypothetical protein
VVKRCLSLLSVLVAVLCQAATALAHDLTIDQLRLFRDPSRETLRGQLLFDPELARDPAAMLPADEAKRRVLAFVRDKLRLEVNGKPCEPSFEVRELWVEGGAVPGDSVMLECATPAARAFRVDVGREFKALVVTVQSPSEGGELTQSSALVHGGELTPEFSFERTAGSGWREGGPEQFETAPGASGSAAASAASKADRAAPARVPDSGFATESLWTTISRFVWLGYVHILPEGLDHVLFVAGLVLGAGRRYRRLLLEISAFTLAHTLTLALGALGWVMIAPDVIEPLIAASIVLVAVENLFPREERRHRLLVVFVFGLIHGQGFAGILRETGLPKETFLTALLSFNVGVELGQLSVVVALALALHFLSDESRMRFAVRPGSLAIAVVGAFWAVTRVFGA